MAHNFSSFSLSHTSVHEALDYIDKTWKELERYNPHDRATLIGLPHPYIIPSIHTDAKFLFQEQYYWDTFFVMQGLFDTKYQGLAFDMLGNVLYLMQRFGVVPNGSRFYFTGRSQPPFLTTMILQFFALNKDKKWLEQSMDIAKEEYRKVWMSQDHPNWRHVFKGLSRYYHIDVMHELAETESGWDMNPRFYEQAMDHIPIDLNSLLFKYEMDFAEAAIIFGNRQEAKDWIKRARDRRDTINHYLWNDKEQFFYDYNYVLGKQSDIASLAAFYPMWAGMVTDHQAHSLVENLSRFEYDGGLTCTEKLAPDIDAKPYQWAHPNGWAPLHFLVVAALIRYGYKAEAKRIAEKWLKTNLYRFKKEGMFYEKYNVVAPDKPAKDGLYPMQVGFGWTNAIFNRLAHDFYLKENLDWFSMPLLANTFNSFNLV